MSDENYYVGFLNENNHPEIQEGEVFLTNETLESFSHCVGWKAKRVGRQAYTRRGAQIPLGWHIYPIFIQKSEIEKAERGECHI